MADKSYHQLSCVLDPVFFKLSTLIFLRTHSISGHKQIREICPLDGVYSVFNRLPAQDQH